jgi:hypothetical protein
LRLTLQDDDGSRVYTLKVGLAARDAPQQQQQQEQQQELKQQQRQTQQ